MMTNETYEIDAGRIEDAKKHIAKVAKKAKKLGVTAPTLTVLKMFIKTLKDVDGEEREYERAIVEISGETPRLAGWRLTGVVEPATETSNLVKSVPGETMPEMYRTNNPRNCDHCKVDRRRNERW